MERLGSIKAASQAIIHHCKIKISFINILQLDQVLHKSEGICYLFRLLVFFVYG